MDHVLDYLLSEAKVLAETIERRQGIIEARKAENAKLESDQLYDQELMLSLENVLERKFLRNADGTIIQNQEPAF